MAVLTPKNNLPFINRDNINKIDGILFILYKHPKVSNILLVILIVLVRIPRINAWNSN